MLHKTQCRLAAALAAMLALAALYASLRGLVDAGLYRDVFAAGTISEFLVAGSLAQDSVSIALGLALILLSLIFWRRGGYKLFIIILGLVSYFFYGYGLYTLQGQYTSIYLVYLAIFSLALDSLIVGLLSFDRAAIEGVRLPRTLRFFIAGFLLLIPAVLVPVWLLQIAPDIAQHVPGDTYGVFVLDLGVVFPALVIIAVLLLRNKPWGNVLAGVGLVKAGTICLSVAFGEWFVSRYGGFPPNYGMIGLFSGITVISLALILFYLRKLEH